MTWSFKMKKKDGHFQQILALWKLERRIHSGENQITSTFVGWVIQLFGIETFKTIQKLFTTHSLPDNRI